MKKDVNYLSWRVYCAGLESTSRQEPQEEEPQEEDDAESVDSHDSDQIATFYREDVK